MELLQHRGQVALLVPGGDEDQQVGHPATVSLPVVPDAPSPTKELFSRRLEQLVDIDTPSEGIEQERVAELLAGWLAPLGVPATGSSEPDSPARSLELRLPGGGRGRGRAARPRRHGVPAGTVAERPFRREGDRCFGPGVADMKGGLVLAAMAMEAFARTAAAVRRAAAGGLRRRGGAAASARRAEARRGTRLRRWCSSAARENGNLVSSRKGALWRTMDLTGRAAHAGADTARGRSAVSALAGRSSGSRGWPRAGRR